MFLLARHEREIPSLPPVFIAYCVPRKIGQGGGSEREICVALSERKGVHIARSFCKKHQSAAAVAAAINFSSPVKNEICSLARTKEAFDICIIFFRSLFIYLAC